MFRLTDKPILTEDLITLIDHESAGGVVTFEGRVRDHNLGRRVQSLEYEVYEELALEEGTRILCEAHKKFNILSAHAVHRFGHLNIKDKAVVIVVSSSHRDAAFLACRYVIDEIKKRVPIWKREHYIDGDPAWVGCPTCHHHSSFHE